MLIKKEYEFASNRSYPVVDIRKGSRVIRVAGTRMFSAMCDNLGYLDSRYEELFGSIDAFVSDCLLDDVRLNEKEICKEVNDFFDMIKEAEDVIYRI